MSEREPQRVAPCQDQTGDLQIMRMTLYQLTQRSFNTIRRPALPHQIHLPWIIHTCSDTMRASDRPFTCLGYLFRQRGSRHGLFLEKDVIPPDRRRRPAGATRFDTGRLVCLIRFLSFPSKTCDERRSFHLVIVLKDAVSNTTEVHDLFVCST